MSIIIYGIKNCDSIKKAKKWLEQNNIEYQFHDYRVDGIDNELLNTFSAQLSWQDLLNKRGTTWRQQPDEIKNNIDEAGALALMLEYPAMIKRPLLVAKSQMILGFKPEQYNDFFLQNT